MFVLLICIYFKCYLFVFVFYLCDVCCLKGGKTATKCCMFTLKKKCMTFRVKHNGCISSFLFLEMQLIPFLMKSFRVIEEITSQVAQEFDVSVMYWKKPEMGGLHSPLISNIPHDFNCYTSCCSSICHLIHYIKISRFSLLKFVQ